jgi:putative CocE/NonD family hydrolase
MKRFALVITLLLTAFGYGLRRGLFAWVLGLPRPRCRVNVERRLMIPMGDGVPLCADHYQPITAAVCPTIVIRSPYGRSARSGAFGLLVEFCAQRFAEQEYNVLVQDTRGRHDSEGEFEPFFYERDDARSTFDWLARQSWFDGQVGLWGTSYLGIVQWVVADDPVVKALMPGITASNLYDIVFPDGALDLSLLIRWMSLLRIQQKRRNSLLQVALLLEVERDVRPAFTHLPIIQANEAMRGGPVHYYRRWLDALLSDPSFADRLRSVDHSQVRAPVHLVGGWYDFFLRGLLDDYAALKAAGHHPYLTVGPWMHYSRLFLMPTMLKPGVEWFDAHLKGERERLRSNPVRLYVMGANEWRDYIEYPPPSRPQRYYVGGGKLLDLQPQDSPPDHYCYDPAHPTPIEGGTQFSIWAGPSDNRKLEARADVLTFTTDPLAQAVEVIGAARVELYVRSSSPYTDFYARLCDVHPKGRSINICDGLLRVEPGKGELQPDGSVHIALNLWATAYRFLPGHRLRLMVSSSAHPRWSRHTNTEHPLTDTITRPAEQTVYHDSTHPSALVLPITDVP